MHPRLPPDRLQPHRFREDGFLAVRRIFEPDALDELRAILDPLFARFDGLPSGIARDIAPLEEDAPYDQIPKTPEINRPLALDRRLRSCRVFEACRDLASTFIGGRARYVFDHAIYKQPLNRRATAWHQDQAYTGSRVCFNTLHFWIPLQAVDELNGCMHFIPGSHRFGLLGHSPAVGHRKGGPLEVETGVDPDAAVACPLAPGDATIHAPLTLHYTSPNFTPRIRRAWILHFGRWGRVGKLHPKFLTERALKIVRAGLLGEGTGPGFGAQARGPRRSPASQSA